MRHGHLRDGSAAEGVDMSEGGGIMDPTDQVPDLPRPLQRGDQLSLYASTVSGEAEGVAATLKVTGRGACSRPVQQLSAMPVWKGARNVQSEPVLPTPTEGRLGLAFWKLRCRFPAQRFIGHPRSLGSDGKDLLALSSSSAVTCRRVWEARRTTGMRY